MLIVEVLSEGQDSRRLGREVRTHLTNCIALQIYPCPILSYPDSLEGVDSNSSSSYRGYGVRSVRTGSDTSKKLRSGQRLTSVLTAKVDRTRLIRSGHLTAAPVQEVRHAA